MLNIEKTTENGALHVILEGDLDTLSSPDLEATLEPLLPEVSSVSFDFEKVGYISSAGLRVLLAAEQAMEEKGGKKIRVVKMNDTIREIFEITGFDFVLSVE